MRAAERDELEGHLEREEHGEDEVERLHRREHRPRGRVADDERVALQPRRVEAEHHGRRKDEVP